MHSSQRFHRLGSEDRAYIDRVCVEHSAAINSDAAVPIEARLISATKRQRPALLLELLVIELGRLLRARSLPTLAILRERHPKIAEAIATIYAELPPHLRLPERLGPYRVTQFIADGGQSRVVLGEDATSRQVLLKIGDGKPAAQQLGREAEILGRLQHRSVRRRIDFGIDGETTYLALEYVAGRNLADAAEASGLAPRRAARIVEDIARAVDHIHQSGFLHRDIKPHNVILADSGRAILIDFALAIDENRGGFRRAPLLEQGGTRAYMAPEQLAGDPGANGILSDIYSLGALLYFALTGVHPNLGDGRTTTQPGRSAMPLAVVAQDLAPAPRRLQSLCLSAMSHDPAERPASAADFAGLLRSYLRGVRLTAAIKVGVPTLLVASMTGPLVWAQVEPSVTKLLNGEGLPWFEQLARRSGSSFEGLDKDAVDVWIEKGYVGRDFFADRSDYEVRLRPKGFPPGLVNELGCECRVGGGEWRTLLVFQGDGYREGDLAHRLSPEEAASQGPVEVRFSNAFGVSREVVLGPFTYDLSVADEIERIVAERRGDFDTVTNCQWLRPTEQGWVFSEQIVPGCLESFRRIVVRDEAGRAATVIDHELKDGRTLIRARENVAVPFTREVTSFPEQHLTREETVRNLTEALNRLPPSRLQVTLVSASSADVSETRSFDWDPRISPPSTPPFQYPLQVIGGWREPATPTGRPPSNTAATDSGGGLTGAQGGDFVGESSENSVTFPGIGGGGGFGARATHGSPPPVPSRSGEGSGGSSLSPRSNPGGGTF